MCARLGACVGVKKLAGLVRKSFAPWQPLRPGGGRRSSLARSAFGLPMDALLRILPKPLVAAIGRRAILRPGAVAFERGGFALAQQALPSGDVVPFYERPARTEDG